MLINIKHLCCKLKFPEIEFLVIFLSKLIYIDWNFVTWELSISNSDIIFSGKKNSLQAKIW